MDTSEQVGTGAHKFGDWILIEEAVAYCHAKGLSRTPKTVRKWANRAFNNSREGEITVRQQDTENGFRWLIERTSLDIKIEQENDIDARRAHGSNQSNVLADANLSEPALTSSAAENIPDFDANPSEPVRTGANGRNDLIVELKAEVDFLRAELRHRRKTDEALQNVITAFRTNAQAQLLQAENKKRDLDRQDSETHDRTMRIFTNGSDQPRPDQQGDNSDVQDLDAEVQ